MVSTELIRTAVGIMGNVFSFILFLSPVPTFHRIRKSRTVERFSAAPYLAALLNCMLWMVYGLPPVHPHSTLVVTINGSGTVIELAYVLLFFVFSAGRRRRLVASLLAIEITFVGAVAGLVIGFEPDRHRRELLVGVLCVFFGTLMYAAPLSVMKMVIRNKSVEYMPLFLSLACFFNGISWTAYALIRFDLFITIPNVLGVLLSTAQLVLHVMYFKSTQRQVEARKQTAQIDLSDMERADVAAVSSAADLSN